jgi:hypothetical protein
MKKITVLLIISVAFLCACNSNKWIRKTVAKQNKFIATLEQHQVEDEIVHKKYNHPIKIDLADFKRLMKDLRYIEQAGFIGEDKENAIFQTVEIDRLAPVLADALAKADDSQRIRFTSFNQGKAFIFSVSRETEGVMFVEPDGRLNIAFHLINSEIDPIESSPPNPGISRVDPLKIKSSDMTIIPTRYTELFTFETGKQAPMWIFANLDTLKETADSEQISIVDVKKNAPPAAASAPKNTKTKTEKATPAQASETMLQKDIKNKLKYLKELLDEGLISEKDYDVKKMELLDKLD